MIPHIAVIVTDANRKIQWVNEDFTEITGYALPEVFGKKPGAILQGPQTEPEAVKRIRKGLASELPIRERLTNYRKSGEEYLCSLVIYPIYNNANKLTNFIAFEVDADQTDDNIIPLLFLKNKYQSSSLKGKKATDLFSRLKGLLEREKSYLDPGLNLHELAELLETNTKYLSQVVNVFTGNNLQVFLNQYRIEEAKKKLLSGEFDNLTLYGIAMQCGFKNKSTFYKVFKQQTGQTPLEFVRTHV